MSDRAHPPERPAAIGRDGPAEPGPAWPGSEGAGEAAGTLGGSAYAQLSGKLTKGHYQPNDRLRIRELADELGTSVTPVRDAVLRLVQDRALVMRSPRDIRVPMLSRADYLEIRAVRMNLEGLAAETAAATASAADLERLARNIELNEAAMKARDAAAGAELNQEFHFAIAEIARMPVLRRILERLWLQMGPLIGEMYVNFDVSLIEHHHVVLAALERGNAELAAAAIRTDIRDAGAPILKRIEAFERRMAASDMRN